MTLLDNSADIPKGQDSVKESQPLSVTDFMDLDESYSINDSKTDSGRESTVQLNNLDIVVEENSEKTTQDDSGEKSGGDSDYDRDFDPEIDRRAEEYTRSILEKEGDLNTADFNAERGQTSSNTVEVDGKQRSFSLRVPESYDPSKPTRLIMAYHGITSNGAHLEERSGLSDSAEDENILVAYMEGSGGRRSSWNNGQLAFSRNDDIEYSQKVLDKVSAHLNVDKQGVYAVGFSQGESMVHRLANDPEFKNNLAGIGVVGGWMTGREKIPDAQVDPNQDDLSVISIKSNADQISPAGGKHNWGFAIMKPESYDESFYRDRNEINNHPIKTEVMNPDGELVYTESSSIDEETGARVKSIKMEDESHIWPGPKEANATVHPENNATKMIIDFFNEIDKNQT